MFTGLIHSLGNIQKIHFFNSQTIELCIRPLNKGFLDNVKIGDSISTNGVCLSVTKLESNYFYVFCSQTSFHKSNLSILSLNQVVNLEKALTVTDRIEGHFVYGHVETTTPLLQIEKNNLQTMLRFKIPKKLDKYVIQEGSIAINGVSLTISRRDENSFWVAIIPITYQSTNLSSLKIQSLVNIETDILIKSMLEKNNSSKNSLKEALINNGFL